MVLTRRQVLSGLAASAMGATLGRTSYGSTARALSLPELVTYCRHALVGTATNSTSRWETTGDSRRIVTYYQVDVAHSIDGRPPSDLTLMVRTLGGRVGHIGQLVHGEAKLEMEAASVLFLSQSVEGLFTVTAMAQGHYPLRPDAERVPRLLPSPNMPELIQVTGSAVERLSRRSLPEAEQLVFESLYQRP